MDPYNSYDSTDLARERLEAAQTAPEKIPASSVRSQKLAEEAGPNEKKFLRFFALALLVYAAVSAFQGEFHIPTRRGDGFTVYGLAAWTMSLSLCCLAAAMWPGAAPRKFFTLLGLSFGLHIAAFLILPHFPGSSPPGPYAGLDPTTAAERVRVDAVIRQANDAVRAGDRAAREAEALQRGSGTR